MTTVRSIPANLIIEEYAETSNDGREGVPITASPLAVKTVPISTRDIVRPTLTVRPVPLRIGEQFYKEAFREGLTMRETNQAAALAHDWHRRWTHQDEQDHTTPHDDFYAQNQIPNHYFFDQDRKGAMNPSLGESSTSPASPMEDHRFKRVRTMECLTTDSHRDIAGIISHPEEEIIFNPEDRLSVFSSTEPESNSFSSDMAPPAKRQLTGAVVEDDIPHQSPFPAPAAHRPLALRPIPVRPIAVRVNPPTLPPARAFLQGRIPQDIVANGRHGSISPISWSAASVGSENLMMSILNRQNVPSHVIDDEEELLCQSSITISTTAVPTKIQSARDGVLHALAITRGDFTSDKFKSALDQLLVHSLGQEFDLTRQQSSNHSIDGMWLNLTKPTYFGCLGENDYGDPMYTLGRMAFDMFSPTNLVCSLQGNFNPIEIVSDEERRTLLKTVPKTLLKEIESCTSVLRTYHIVSAFTIEPSLASYPDAPNEDVHRPIKGIMTTYGYSVPDPSVAKRQSIWFTGGRLEPNDDPKDVAAWKEFFTLHPPKHTFGEKAKLLAAKLLMGATVPETMAEDGSFEYSFTRPLGGHGMAYVDVVYLDETLRIFRGHRGTVFVFSRLPKNHQF